VRETVCLPSNTPKRVGKGKWATGGGSSQQANSVGQREKGTSGRQVQKLYTGVEADVKFESIQGITVTRQRALGKTRIGTWVEIAE